MKQRQQNSQTIMVCQDIYQVRMLLRAHNCFEVGQLFYASRREPFVGLKNSTYLTAVRLLL